MPIFDEAPILSARASQSWNEWRHRNPDFCETNAKRWWTPDGVKPPSNTDVIDLSVAENTLMIEELKAQVATKFSSTLTDRDFTYGEGPGGSSRLRTHLAAMVNQYFNIPIPQPVEKEHIVTTPGVYSAMEQISWAVGNPGDGILVGRPYYGGFIQGFARSRSRVKIVGVEFGSVDPFSREATVPPITAILLCNPNNPTGRCFSREVLEDFIALSVSYNIHLISDEIYALSTFRQTAVPFTSLLSIPVDSKAASRIHVLYGMSKDFGASGIRIAAIISRSVSLVNSILTGSSYLSWVSSAADTMWSAILTDGKFLRGFIGLNQERLGRCWKLVTTELARNGIKYETRTCSGVFVWIYLGYAGKEEAINERLIDMGVKLSPGRKFRSEEEGWFRLTFARPEDRLREAVKRIVKAIGTPETPRVSECISS
ncbi:pyridoxal phosphate-dependent transferase [Pyronema domesticum]|nr:pyridoxal phosphate-dependent transferase [Pyronema domesticum]